MRAKSIISNTKRCYLCGRTADLTVHHCIFGTANRSKADEDGLWVYLCPSCHHTVHNSGAREKRILQMVAQEHWQSCCGSKEDFIERYGKSYI